ncbi:MAG TPA: PIN domain-containing protein [Capsulimonadaceae bacterium]
MLDACVLYPPSLRDLLMRLAAAGIYFPKWTDEIQAEWVRHVIADKPAITLAELERTCTLMEQVTGDSVVRGYEAHVAALKLPDADDRHVLAAAITAQARFIVTYNVSDFPDYVLGCFGVGAVHPDIFLSALLDERPDPFLVAIRRHRMALKNPPKTVDDYIATLKTNRLTQLAKRIDEYRDEI